MESNTPASSPSYYALLSEHLKMAQDPTTSPNLTKNPPPPLPPKKHYQFLRKQRYSQGEGGSANFKTSCIPTIYITMIHYSTSPGQVNFKTSCIPTIYITMIHYSTSPGQVNFKTSCIPTIYITMIHYSTSPGQVN